MPAPETLTLRVEGTPEEHGYVRLANFIEQLDAVKAALRYSDEAAGVKAYYRVIDLRHSSPATVVLERITEVPRGATRVQGRRAGGPRELVAGLKGVRSVRVPPPRRDGRTEAPVPAAPRTTPDFERAETYLAIAETVTKRVDKLVLQAARHTVTIDQAFKQKLEAVLGPDEITIGSIAGRLDAVLFHGKPRFVIYPIAGPARVTCTCSDELKSRVIASIEQYVTVYGRLRYKSWSDHPHAVDVEALDVHPAKDTLPTLRDLQAMAPDLTGDLTSEEFLQQLRSR